MKELIKSLTIMFMAFFVLLINTLLLLSAIVHAEPLRPNAKTQSVLIVNAQLSSEDRGLTQEQLNLITTYALTSLNSKIGGRVAKYFKATTYVSVAPTMPLQVLGADIQQRYAELGYYQELFRQWDAPTAYAIAFAPPLVRDDGKRQWGGLAGSYCAARQPKRNQPGARVATVNIQRVNVGEFVMNDHFAEVAVVQHELLHMLGAYHYSSEDNIMSSNLSLFAKNYGLGEVPLLERTKREVFRCLRVKGKNK